jgi:hypothetical protein
MKYAYKAGVTSQTIYVVATHATTGAALTGLAWNTAGLVCYYARVLGSATAITLVTQTVTGAYSSGGFVEVHATNMPGLYRLDLPDAVLAAGVRSVVIELSGAANLLANVSEIELVAYDPTNATTLGLTNLATALSTAMWTDTRAGYLDLIQTKLNTVPITVVALAPPGGSPLGPLVIGTDYLDADGLAVTFSSTSWPSLTGATVKLKHVSWPGVADRTCTVVSASSVRCEFPRSLTTTYPAGSGTYRLEATLASGNIVSLITGSISAQK